MQPDGLNGGQCLRRMIIGNQARTAVMQMTQVVTVSANTAAYAMEAMKPPPKPSRSEFVRQTVRAFAAEAADGEVDLDAIVGGADVVRSTSTDLLMLNSGKHPPQTSVQEAIAAYRRAED